MVQIVCILLFSLHNFTVTHLSPLLWPEQHSQRSSLLEYCLDTCSFRTELAKWPMFYGLTHSKTPSVPDSYKSVCLQMLQGSDLWLDWQHPLQHPGWTWYSPHCTSIKGCWLQEVIRLWGLCLSEWEQDIYKHDEVMCGYANIMRGHVNKLRSWEEAAALSRCQVSW